MKTYAIKEIYYTLQGEGYHAGRPAVFCRFAGCNLWTGLEKDRATAICNFCDTEFHGTDGVNGGKYALDDLGKKILSLWPVTDAKPFIVFTGGEPALQLDADLVDLLHQSDAYIAIETNGTVDLNGLIDWVCVSPKANTNILVNRGDELKLVYPQKNVDPQTFENFEFDHFYIQPMDSDKQNENIAASIDFCKKNPRWKLSIQTHKVLQLP